MGTPALFRDTEDGTVLAISDSIPDGLTLDATPVTPNTELLAKTNGAGAARGPLVSKGSDDGFHGGGGKVRVVTIRVCCGGV